MKFFFFLLVFSGAGLSYGEELVLPPQTEVLKVEARFILLSATKIGAHPGPKTDSLQVTRRKGPESCTLEIIGNDSHEAHLKENSGNASDCEFQVSLFQKKMLPLDIRGVKEGGFEFENWSAPISLKFEKGDVSFFNIEALDVHCDACDLGGEGLFSLKYKIGIGTIGVIGLKGSVEGVFRGDAILKWVDLKKTPDHQPAIYLKNSAGDIFLQIPSKSSVKLDLSAPKGEVYAKKVTSVDGGIPIKVQADLGTIRVTKR